MKSFESNARLLLVSILLFALHVAHSGEAPPADVPPVTKSHGEVAELLKKWFAEGTAAGNIGDIYDNRDREHSGLDMSQYPQLQKFKYSKEELDKRADWALFGGVRQGIVFGNSSTSAGAYEGGSNPRRAYSMPQGLEVLYRQYSSNNVYMYPEHRDHDPGHNGVNDGYGDLYPTNTPFVIISQGSSGTDQPFMHAVPKTLAALRPAVKKILAEKGMLMPAVQMILRYTNKHLTDPAKDYVSGKAHPSVFEGSWVNDVAMVKLAHEFTPESMPPLVKLSIVEEDKPRDGLDFFEPGATEVLANTPAVIARIFRGRQYTRRIVVSAKDSVDLNQKPLKYYWSVLRGDPAKISIKPHNEAGTEVEIVVTYQERSPISLGSPMESNRIDIGAFAHNGTYFSAPAFITFFSLDHEARAYSSDGRILEIGYKTGETTVSVSDWPKMLTLFSGEPAGWPAQFLRAQFKADDVKALGAAAPEYAPLVAAVAAAEETRKQAHAAMDKASNALKDAEKKAAEAAKDAQDEAAKQKTAAADERKKAEQVQKDADKNVETAKAAVEGFLHKKRDGLSDAIAPLVEGVLRTWQKQPDFLVAHQPELAAYFASADGKSRAGAYNNACQRLATLGMLNVAEGKTPELRLIRAGAEPLAQRVTRFEQAMLERSNGDILSQVIFSGVVASNFRVNYVQPEISEPPDWRDVYRYAADGTPQGWTRYGGDEPVDFNAEGLIVVKRDALGRSEVVRKIAYQPEPMTPELQKKRGWPMWRKTLQIPAAEISTYAYESDKDIVGKIVKTEAAPLILRK